MSFVRFRICLEDFVAEGDEITDRRPVYHERRAEGPSVYFRRYFVASRDKITGRRPVNYERRAAGPSVQISSYYEQRAEGPCV